MQHQRRHPFDEARPGSLVALRVSLHNEIAPAGGVVDPPFRWDDVLHVFPPGAEERGPPAWCEHAPAVLTAEARVENAVLVSLVDGRVEIEDRLAVTTRALAPMIVSERETVGARLEQAKAAAHQRADEADHRVEELIHRGIASLFAGMRAVTRGVASVPDRVANASRRAYAFLSTPEGRRRFRAGLTDPHALTAEQKAVTLFVGVCAILGGLALLHFAVTLAAPDLARPWRTLFFLFLYAFVAAVGLPMPIEPALLPAALLVGPWPAIAATLCAKVLAAWMVFFLGDEVGHRLRHEAERRPWLARLVGWSERFAERFGVLAVATFLAIPGAPDAIALYVFGSLHMRLWKFLLGVAIGGLILYTGLAFGLLALFG